MLTFIFIAHCALMNWLRGSGRVSRPVPLFLIGAMAAVLQGDPMIGIIVFLGLWIWAAPGWGEYFICMKTPDALPMYHARKGEVKIVDWLANKTVHPVLTDADARRWGIMAMAIRASIFSLPLFLALSVATRSLDPLLYLQPLTALQGFIYGASRYVRPGVDPIPVAEVGTGILFGLLISLSL